MAGQEGKRWHFGAWQKKRVSGEIKKKKKWQSEPRMAGNGPRGWEAAQGQHSQVKIAECLLSHSA